jgi:hypothetical protein
VTRATAAAKPARSLSNTDCMAAEDPPALRAPWPEVISALVAAGWARAPRAVDPALAARLGEDDGRVWRLAGDDGVVRQHVLGSYTHYHEALPLVRAVGGCLVAGLSAEAGRRDLPPRCRLAVPPRADARSTRSIRLPTASARS